MNDSSSSKPLSSSAVLGIVLSVLLIVLGVAFLIYWVLLKLQRRKKVRLNLIVQMNSFKIQNFTDTDVYDINSQSDSRG